LERDETKKCFSLLSEAELRTPHAIEFAEQAGFFVKLEPHFLLSEYGAFLCLQTSSDKLKFLNLENIIEKGELTPCQMKGKKRIGTTFELTIESIESPIAFIYLMGDNIVLAYYLE
jgi:hypothetical protein